MRKCRNCKWWNDRDNPKSPLNEHTGQCRRLAPRHIFADVDRPVKIEPVDIDNAVWPFTNALDWCGEGVAK